MNQKAVIGASAVLFTVVILLFIGWWITESLKECRTDNDCEDYQYCTAQNTCRDHQIIEIERAAPSQTEQTAWIIGISIIIAAIILKWDTIFARKKPDPESVASHSYVAEPDGMFDDSINEEI